MNLGHRIPHVDTLRLAAAALLAMTLLVIALDVYTR